jgi:hypothetical protein
MLPQPRIAIVALIIAIYEFDKARLPKNLFKKEKLGKFIKEDSSLEVVNFKKSS